MQKSWTWSGMALLLACGLAQASPQGGEDIAKRLEAAPHTHPRLFLDPSRAEAVKRKIAADPMLTRALAHVRACADATLRAPPVARQKVGRRLLGVSRTCLKRVVCLAFAHRMTGEARYLERAQREMLAAAAFDDWNPSHFLDVAEMTAALAIGYDWLHPGLDPAARAAIRGAIVNKGLKPSLAGGWWVTTTNNWNQVCHGGLCLGALAVLEDERALAAQIVARAVKNVPRAMREYEPHGAYPEGPGYWKYGTTYNVLLIDALQSVLGTAFGLAAPKGFLRSADYYLHMTGPTGLFFNYSDCGTKGGVAPAMYWFAAKRQDGSLLWRERAALAEFVRDAKPSATGANRLLPFLLIWARDGGAAPPSGSHFNAGGRTPVAVHRSGWESTATFVAVKGGSPGANHAHMDIGSFVMDADGVRWALDLGAQSYHSLESKGIRLWDRSQDSQRWTVFRLNNLAHNTLVVDGNQQVVKGSAPIVRFVDRGSSPHTIVDLSNVYAGQLAAARRGVALRPDRSILIQDEITAPERGTVVRWGMVTRAKVKSVRDGTAVLVRGGRRLELRVLAPEGAMLETYETERPAALHDHPNPGTRMIGFKVKLEASAVGRLAVLLAPGTAGGESPEVRRLADW
ncbi:MAG: heparinase [Planctomycetes bacterium]|nr:heparinase [Planctomycetota bacterium]